MSLLSVGFAGWGVAALLSSALGASEVVLLSLGSSAEVGDATIPA
jgi:hypothetical protein